MGLSKDIISQFVKVTNDNKEDTKETLVFGEVIEVDAYGRPSKVYLDGASESDPPTPVSSTVSAKPRSEDGKTPGDRVLVTIKNHHAFITGNLGSQALTEGSQKIESLSTGVQTANSDIDSLKNKIVEFDTVYARKASHEELFADVGRIKDLTSDSLLVETVKANKTAVDELEAKYGKFENLEAVNAAITELQTKKLDAETAKATYAEIKDLEAANVEIDKVKAYSADINELKADNVEINEKLDANEASINDLETKKLSATDAAITYANIDFSNIGEAALKKILADSGLIKDIIIGDGTITGKLVGVTITGDLIEGNTVVADKLVVKGEDGLYYKLNTDGIKTEAEQTDYNSLNGSIIKAKSITATKISVDDLVAFDATIGGFNITSESLYSGVKETVDNATNGVYLDRDGQMYIGDGDNYIRYFKDENGNWKLEISADYILFGHESKSSASDIKELTEHVKIGTYIDPETDESQPCVELSEGDSNFKQVITNTKTVFMDGSVERTKIDTDGISSNNISATDELRVGGFVLKVRSNGNLGLVWRGGNK